MGRPSLYTPEVAALICERLEGGESLRQICRDEGMPSVQSVLRWAEALPFSEQYEASRRIGYLVLADEILEIADTPELGVETKTKADGTTETTEGDMLAHRRLRVDTRKWMLSKMLPKVYGDKQQIEHSGAIDLAGAVLAARKRAGKAE